MACAPRCAQDEINGVDDDASVFIQEEEGSALTALVGHTLTYDVRDTQFLPSDGYLIRFDQRRCRLRRRHPVPAQRAAGSRTTTRSFRTG